MQGAGECVCGIEQANCLIHDRSEERRAGRLKTLPPGGESRFTLKITLSETERVG